MFIRPQRFDAIVIEKTYLSHKVIELTLALKEPKSINFLAGQFISLEVSDGEYRAYSISSPETENNYTRLIVEVSHLGKGAELVKNIKVGESVKFIGPSGKFTLPNALPEKIVFVATGVGLAPFESMLNKLRILEYPGKIELFFGVRNQEDLFKEDFLKDYERLNGNFKYYLCFSQKMPEQTLPYFYDGRVTKVLPSTLDLRLYKNALFLLCGNAQMINDVKDILQNQHIKEENILFEKFTDTSKR